MTDDLVVVRQLPEIEEHLRDFKQAVDLRVGEAMQMVCSEDTLTAVKKTRAELGKTFKGLEEQRKAVKRLILEPYDKFELVYSECVSAAFKAADAALKSRIDEVEENLKAQKSARIKAFFDEYCASVGVDFVPFERAVPVVVRSVSEKKYKEACAEFIDRVVADLAMIEEQEHADEIRAEYKRTLNASQAVTTVAERHRAIEAEKVLAEERRIAAENRQRAAEKVETVIDAVVANNSGADTAFAPPVAEPQDAEPIYEVQFTIRGTRDQIKELKQYLTERGLINE